MIDNYILFALRLVSMDFALVIKNYFFPYSDEAPQFE
jgi:hypothetical protein